MKTIIVAIALLIVTTAHADARKRQRITVYPQQRALPIAERPIAQHPYAVQYVLSSLLCAFHVFSLGPNARPGSVGSCAEHLRLPTQHRRV